MCLSCNVGVLWPNGWMDHDATWYGGRPRPGHIVLNWDPAHSPRHQKGALPTFSPHLLWPNGWMDQSATLYGARPRPRRHCVRWEPSSHTERSTAAPTFRPMSIVAKRSPISATVWAFVSIFVLSDYTVCSVTPQCEWMYLQEIENSFNHPKMNVLLYCHLPLNLLYRATRSQ